MKTIWKFPLAVTDKQTVSMPKGSRILSANEQHGQVCIWALVNTEAEREEKSIAIVGTGNPFTLDESWKFVDSVQQSFFVWHVFVKD